MSAILRSGFEAGELTAEGWNSISGDDPDVLSSKGITDPREDINSLGGDYFIAKDQNSSAGFDCARPLLRNCQEGFVKVAALFNDLNGIGNASIIRLFQSGTEILSSDYDNGNSIIRVRRGGPGGNIIVNSDVGTIASDNTWRVYLIHYYIDNSDGIVNVYKDFDFGSPVGTFTGDTQNDNSLSEPDTFGFSVTGANSGDPRVAYDDIAINDITMTYASGS